MSRRKAAIRIGDAGPKGRGLFATASIAPLTRVATFLGTSRWIWEIPERYWPYAFQVDYDRYVLPRANSRARYINHSCDPNCVISGRSVITERRIAKGEELTFDYSTDVDWPDYSMECRCGSPKCRRVVRAYRFLSKRLKSRYGRSIADYIVVAPNPYGANPRQTGGRPCGRNPFLRA